MWRQMAPECIEPPENWSGPLDIAEVDDYGTEVTDTGRDDWDAPLAEYRADGAGEAASIEDGEEEYPTDEWGDSFPSEEPLDNP